MKLFLILVLFSHVFASNSNSLPKEDEIIQKILLKYCKYRMSSGDVTSKSEIKRCMKMIENKRNVELIVKNSRKYRKKFQIPFKWGKRQEEIIYDDDDEDYILDILNDNKRKTNIRSFLPFRWG